MELLSKQHSASLTRLYILGEIHTYLPIWLDKNEWPSWTHNLQAYIGFSVSERPVSVTLVIPTLGFPTQECGLYVWWSGTCLVWGFFLAILSAIERLTSLLPTLTSVAGTILSLNYTHIYIVLGLKQFTDIILDRHVLLYWMSHDTPQHLTWYLWKNKVGKIEVS